MRYCAKMGEMSKCLSLQKGCIICIRIYRKLALVNMVGNLTKKPKITATAAVCCCSTKYLFVKNFAKFKFCQRSATLLKRRLQHMCFPLKFAKFLTTSFLQNTSGCCFDMIVININILLYMSQAQY